MALGANDPIIEISLKLTQLWDADVLPLVCYESVDAKSLCHVCMFRVQWRGLSLVSKLINACLAVSCVTCGWAQASPSAVKHMSSESSGMRPAIWANPFWDFCFICYWFFIY